MSPLRVGLAALLLLAAPALAPAASAAPSAPEYPPEFLALVPRWIEEAEALASADDRTREWYPEAESFLLKARNASAEGRLRVATFHLETYRELVIAHQLDDASRGESSDAERRTFILQRTAAAKADLEADWARFREELHAYDGKLRSLQTIEKVVYVADVALTSMLVRSDYDAIAREFPKQPGVPFGYTHALVRSTHTPIATLDWARDMLAEAVRQEGLPPRVLDEPWSNLTTAVLNVPEGEVPQQLESLEELSAPARANGESLLAIAAALAEQRTQRAYGMQTIFGDAGSRGLDVIRDASRGMNKQLNNTTLETPRSYGLAGIFTSDAIDRAQFTNEFLRAGQAELGTVIVAWSGLEHATYALVAFSQVSPVQPPPPEEAETPGIGHLMLLGALVAAALVAAVLVKRRR